MGLCANPTSLPWLQTSDPDVYAVGDVAAFPLKLTGAVTRQEHVTNSRCADTSSLPDLFVLDLQVLLAALLSCDPDMDCSVSGMKPCADCCP